MALWENLLSPITDHKIQIITYKAWLALDWGEISFRWLQGWSAIQVEQADHAEKKIHIYKNMETKRQSVLKFANKTLS